MGILWTAVQQVERLYAQTVLTVGPPEAEGIASLICGNVSLCALCSECPLASTMQGCTELDTNIRCYTFAPTGIIQSVVTKVAGTSIESWPTIGANALHQMSTDI